ncbi:MAG: hypothetical protein LBC75_08495 [Fibromonadaceae bacterium]|jgi:hypothetical protein|nr:hypothetical protein [Fibromonadaceae bacterium]
MRLNRVLLLAATITTMMFALVFTISCSGEDGKNGANGKGCTMEQDDNDWNIICDGEEVGTIHGGDGKDGTDGQPGKDGDNCWLNRVGSSYEVRCGAGNGQLKGNLDGCSLTADIEENPYQVTLICGKNEVNLCNNKIYDATEDACGTNGVIQSGGAISWEFCPSLTVSSKGIKYNSKKQYCGFGEGDDEKYNGQPGTVYDFCGPTSNDQPNKTEYNAEEYCRYLGINSKYAKLAGTETGDYCNGKPINKDAWKGEYCGYASNDVKIKSIITGICDSTAEANGPQGPNELAFGQGYCEVKFSNRKNGRTTYSENLCGTSENNKPNNGVWKNEYCGFAAENSAAPTKVYAGLCDDSKSNDELYGPHMLGYNQGYCRANRLDSTTYTETDFCGEDPTQRPNDGQWKGEYCGYSSATDTGPVKALSGICDNDEGPSQDSWNPNEYCEYDNNEKKTFKTENVCDNGDKINENEWKTEYCGYARGETKTSRQTGVCDNGDGPNSVEFGGGYCQVPVENRLTGKTVYTDDFCGQSGKVNEGKWKGEYCGYANKNSEDDDKVWTGVCDDGSGKHKGGYDQPGYCYSPSEGAPTVFGARFCGTNGKYNENGWKGEYCYSVDQKVGKCAAGLLPDLNVASTSAARCVLPATMDRCTRDSLFTATPQVKGKYQNNLCYLDPAPVATPNPFSSTKDLDQWRCEIQKGGADTDNRSTVNSSGKTTSRDNAYVEKTCIIKKFNTNPTFNATNPATLVDETNLAKIDTISKCIAPSTSKYGSNCAEGAEKIAHQAAGFTPWPSGNLSTPVSVDSIQIRATLKVECTWAPSTSLRAGKCQIKVTQANPYDYNLVGKMTSSTCSYGATAATGGVISGNDSTSFTARCYFTP